MRTYVGIMVGLLLCMLSSCGLFDHAAPAPMTTSPATTPSRERPASDYVVTDCGVRKAAPGEPSKVLLTIDDFPDAKGASKGEVMTRVADWAKDKRVMMEAFPIKARTDEYKKATGVDLVKEVRSRGTYVSNHTLNHLDLTKLDPNVDPKKDPEKVIAEIKGGVTSTYLRPPYGAGAFDPKIKEAAEKEGYRVCTWTLDTNDWRLENGRYPSATELVRRVHEQLVKVPTGAPVVILGHYFTNYPDALDGIYHEVTRMKNTVCKAPSGPVTEEVPFPIC